MFKWLQLIYQTGRLAYEFIHEFRHEHKQALRARELEAVKEAKIAAKARSCAGHEHEDRCK